MAAAELKGKNVVIWGMGREGRAAAEFIRKIQPDAKISFADENSKAETIGDYPAARGVIDAALEAADIIVKSPGVSLYHPLAVKLKAKGTPITSLLNLWFAQPRRAKTIVITGTKGKSTTTSLLVHALAAAGKKAAAVGNIGVPVTEADGNALDFAVIEVSSFQAANFDGMCDIAILTSLYPEHLDWHGSPDIYFRDKLNLLARSKIRIVNAEAAQAALERIPGADIIPFNDPEYFYERNGIIYERDHPIGEIKNRHLARHHNLLNICAALTALRQLGFDPVAALRSMETYQGLPHRQQELGEKNGVLFVDDSISTTPQSAIAAMEAYAGRPITLIAGGYDRGVDYAPLTDHILARKIHAVICIGPAGKRIFEALQKAGAANIHPSPAFKEAVEWAGAHTPPKGVVLLSPAAPSFDMFKDYVERGMKFAAYVNEIPETSAGGRA